MMKIISSDLLGPKRFSFQMKDYRWVKLLWTGCECQFGLIVLRLLSYSNWSRIHNHLVRKRILNHLTNLVKWQSVCLQTNWLWVRIPLLPLKRQISYLLRARSSLTFRQIYSVDSETGTWHNNTNSESFKSLLILNLPKLIVLSVLIKLQITVELNNVFFNFCFTKS